jgi:hypothetical protein
MPPKLTRGRRILLVAIIFLASPLRVHAALTFDLRAVSATGSLQRLDNKRVLAHGIVGEIVAELWGVVSGQNSNTNDDRLANFAVRFLSDRQLVRGDLDNAFLRGYGLQSGYWLSPAASHGALADLDGDGDLDIGGPLATATTGWGLGRHPSPPTYIGQGPVAEFLLYRFRFPADPRFHSADLATFLEVQPHPTPTEFAWFEDGVLKDPISGRLDVEPGITVFTPEPSSIALALFAIAGIAFTLHRRRENNS